MIDRIKVGDVLMDGVRREHIVISLDGPADRPIVTKHHAIVFTFMADGRYLRSSPSDYDLILPKRTRTITRWVNVYPNFEHVLGSESEARHGEGYNSIAIAVPVTFTVEY